MLILGIRSDTTSALAALQVYFFYALLVRLPDTQRRNRMKRSLSAHYLAFRKDLISGIVGTADGSYDSDIVDSLLDRSFFRKYFKEHVTEGQERWEKFLNRLDAYKVREIITSMEIFRDEIQFVLNNVYIEDDAPFEFFKRLSAAIYEQKDTSPEYDDVKRLSRFLWSLLSGWDWVEGYRERDIVQDMIDAI